MQIGILDQKHPTYDEELWADVSALYAGGKAFRARLSRMLVRNPMEPPETYINRQREACYRSYLGPIIDYYASWLFSDQFTIRATDKQTGEHVETDSWYARFKEDVGSDMDLHNFMRERTTEALQKQHAHWIVEFPADGLPEPKDKADFTSRGLGNARLRAVNREALYDWEMGDDGELVWCIVHSTKAVRPTPLAHRTRIIEQWKVYDATFVETFQIEYEGNARPSAEEEAASVDRRPHGARRVPLVTLSISDGLWIGGRVFAPQLEHFRLSCGLSWAIRRTCYAMPILKLENDERAPTMGAGYYMKLGTTESFEWAAPPDSPFAVIAAEVEAQRDEIYRITHQLALSVDGSSTAIGRSGDSKEADSLATRVMLIAYAAEVRAAIEETFEVVSDGRGDIETTFSVEGMNAFDTAAPAELVANAIQSDALNIPSPTFKKEFFSRVALALVPDVDMKTKDTIQEEIRNGVDQEVELREELNIAELEALAKVGAAKALQPDGTLAPDELGGAADTGGDESTKAA
jgi:hypothetical protein